MCKYFGIEVLKRHFYRLFLTIALAILHDENSSLTFNNKILNVYMKVKKKFDLLNVI